MWKLEIIGQQYYLNTQDTVYEVLSKTPEEILCKRPDAVKIDMMIKQSLQAEPDPEFNVRFVPYLDLKSGAIIDPNVNKKCSRNVALAVAYIAADKNDWSRFIPVGMRIRELSKEKQRLQQVVEQQRAPFQKKKKEDAQDDDEEYELCDNQNNNDDECSDNEIGQHDEDDDVDDKVSVYNAKTKRFIPATKAEEEEFDMVMHGQQPTDPQTQPPQPLSAVAKSFDKSTDDLYARVAKVRSEHEQQLQKQDETLPSDLKRRQAAMLNDPTTEPILSELTQSDRAHIDNRLDIHKEREAARAKDCGIGAEPNANSNSASSNVLDRFAPNVSLLPAEPPITVAPMKKPQPTQYTISDLMKFGATTKLPPSIQQEVNRNKQPPAVATPLTNQQSIVNAAPPQHSAKISLKMKEIRRKHCELMLLYADLDELIQ